MEQALCDSSIDKKISVLNETIINVMSNYTLNETKVFDEKNLPWMNKKIESLITAKYELLKKHSKNNRNFYHTYKYKALKGKLGSLIESSKQRYYKRASQNQSSTSTNSKCYWYLLKRILNDKKIPIFSSLFRNNKFMSNFTETRKLFNENFSKQCSLIENSTTIFSVLTPLTNKSLSSFQFTANDIKSIINK